MSCGAGRLVRTSDTLTTTTASPTAPTMNSALPVQVKARMPPRIATKAMRPASMSTASEKETGRNSAAINAATLISATSRSAVGGSCITLAVMRSVRERKR